MPTRFQYTLLAIIIMSITIANCQNICDNCVSDDNTWLCNNIGCQGFILLQSQNTTQIISQINCINNLPCFYSPNPNPKTVHYYLFCNYTFPGCQSCSNSQTCAQCQNGFYPHPFNTQLALFDCKSCPEAIGGCQLCYTPEFCSQCSQQYQNVFGRCYTNNGNIVGSTSKPWNKNGSTPTQIITAVQLFLIALAIAFVLYKFCFQTSPQQKGDIEKTNQSHRNIHHQQTYPNSNV